MTTGSVEVPAKVSEGFGVTAMERSVELASRSVEAAAKAEVESAYVMAMRNPRSPENARAVIVSTCGIPSFAAKAKYRKKVGSKNVNGQWQDEYAVGPSIRFAEEMLRCWRNVLVQQTTIFDDASKRIVKVRVVDLESNVGYSKEITLEKEVERRDSRNREVLGKRLTSGGQTVFLVKATEDELVNKEAAHASKTIRNNGLRLIPTWIIEDAMQAVNETLAKKITENPNAERLALLDGFAKRGVLPTDLEKYLGVPTAQFSVAHLVQLREVLTSLEDGQSTWSEYAEVGPGVEVQSKISEASQPENQGQRLVQEMAENKPDSSQVKSEPGGPTQEKGAGQSEVSSKQGDAPMSEDQKRYRVQRALSELNTVKGGDAFIRGLKLPPNGIPADQLDFYLKQMEQGIARLRGAAKK